MQRHVLTVVLESFVRVRLNLNIDWANSFKAEAFCI